MRQYITYSGLRRGCGVTAHNYEDAFNVLREQIFRDDPIPQIYLNLGVRVGISWNADDKDLLPELAEVLKREALPFLNSKGTLQGLTEALIHNSSDARTQQAIAYRLAVKGDIEPALVALDLLILSLEVEFPWQQNLKDQAQALKTALTENPSKAQQQLSTWEHETVKNLGLKDFR